ncbi:MAG TPA: hypothetical protein VF108_08460 [Actinomycetota bacterium]
MIWGFVDQSFSSATNFALSVIAGRAVGPEGLGTVAIAFSIYLIAVGLQRRLLTEPLLAGSASDADPGRMETARHGLTMSLTAGCVVTAIAALAGLIVPGFAGRGAWLVAPWLTFGLVQDFWRNILFRDQRAAAAATNDLAWLVTMAVTTPIALSIGSETAVVASWGIGAAAAALLGAVQTSYTPRSPRSSLGWWRAEAWPFGKWNAGAAVAANLSGNLGVFALAGILGAGALGGLRAAQAVFAPLTLITPAITLPGLPAVARAHARSFHEARRRAFLLSGVAFSATLAYVAILLLGGWRLLPLLFGEGFAPFRSLIWPIAAGQLFVAAGIGLLVLIKAQRRGRLLLVNRAVSAIVGLALLTLLAWAYGLQGAAWGTAAAGLVSTVILTWSGVHPPSVATATDPTGLTGTAQS